VLCAGAQHSVDPGPETVLRSGDCLLVEELTYPAFVPSSRTFTDRLRLARCKVRKKRARDASDFVVAHGAVAMIPRMRLTPTELDRLTLFTAAELARRRRGKGWRLNHPEALALVADEMHEAARGGATYEQVVEVGRTTLTRDDVLPGVAELIGTIHVECLFGDGMRVLRVERPIRPGKAGDT
jgi:urease gamma subunit